MTAVRVLEHGPVPTVLAIDQYRDNGQLIHAASLAGYLTADGLTLDATYGLGIFWSTWRPHQLIGLDLNVGQLLDPRAKVPRYIGGDLIGDFTALPFRRHSFRHIVLDPPYKLNGTPAPGEVDRRFGVDRVDTREGRTTLCLRGIVACAELVEPGGTLLVKCQDQVNGGRTRWQTRDFADCGEHQGLRLVDQLHKQGGRPQPRHNPDGSLRRPKHAAHNYSTLLVFEAPPRSRRRCDQGALAL